MAEAPVETRVPASETGGDTANSEGGAPRAPVDAAGEAARLITQYIQSELALSTHDFKLLQKVRHVSVRSSRDAPRIFAKLVFFSSCWDGGSEERRQDDDP